MHPTFVVHDEEYNQRLRPEMIFSRFVWRCGVGEQHRGAHELPSADRLRAQRQLFASLR